VSMLVRSPGEPAAPAAVAAPAAALVCAIAACNCWVHCCVGGGARTEPITGNESLPFFNRIGLPNSGLSQSAPVDYLETLKQCVCLIYGQCPILDIVRQNAFPIYECGVRHGNGSGAPMNACATLTATWPCKKACAACVPMGGSGVQSGPPCDTGDGLMLVARRAQRRPHK